MRMDGGRLDGPAADGQRTDAASRMDAAGDAAPAPRCAPGGATPLDLGTVERVIVLGDGRASTPSWTAAWPALLGQQLAALAPRARLVRLERAGASFASLAEAPELLCACAGGACRADPPPCTEPTSTAATLVVVQLGTVDLLQVFLRLAQDPMLGADPAALLADFRAQVRATLALLDDPRVFARRPALRVLGLPDPSDGTGDLDALVQRVFNLPISTHVAPADALRVLLAMNQLLAEEAGACGGALVELAPAFLGHAIFFDDVANPNHHADDPSPWLSGLYGVSARGAYETWRLLAAALGAPAAGARPSFRDPSARLPMVPASGWAKAVVSAHITPMIMTDFGEAPNTATDPGKALGAPGSNPDDAVALGVLGADLVVDLGAGTSAGDGPGDDILVLETGPMSAGIGEPYRVYAATQPDGPYSVVGDGYGEQAFDLAGSAVPLARYLRIVSLATRGDIVRGPGSPFFPGGEIDAVGAVFPR